MALPTQERGTTVADKVLTFHPDLAITTYPITPGYPIFLRTSDDICFFTTIPFLCEISGFFEDMFSSPHLRGGASKDIMDNMIDLSLANVESTTLHIALNVLSDQKTSDATLMPFAYGSADFEITIVNLKILNDLYRFRAFWPRFANHPSQDLPMRFVITSIGEEEQPAEEAYAQVKNIRYSEYPLIAQKLLALYAPHYIVRMVTTESAMEQQKQNKWDNFVTKLCAQHAMLDFGKKCRAGDGCSSFRHFNANFEAMCQAAIRRVIRCGSLATLNIEDDVGAIVVCSRCANRVTAAFCSIAVRINGSEQV